MEIISFIPLKHSYDFYKNLKTSDTTLKMIFWEEEKEDENDEEGTKGVNNDHVLPKRNIF